MRRGPTLKIETVEFVCSAGRLDECPAGRLPEVAVSGRSNVGKSSLLNRLLGRQRLAHVSGTPGKTQRLHFFRVNERFHVVDLPGYGYARAPQEVQDGWRRMMQDYLQRRQQLCGIIQLVDCRHAPSREDRDMVAWLLAEHLGFCLVPTKMDKLRPGERRPALLRLLASLELPEEQPLVPFSSRSGEGVRELHDWLAGVLAVAGPAGEGRSGRGPASALGRGRG